MDLSYTLRNVMIGSSILGVVGGVVGSFALLRRQSLLGDALAHAALPGVCLAFLITGTKTPVALLLGAMTTGVIGSLCVLAIVRWSRVKEDGAIGIVLSVFFGIGTVLLTRILHLPGGNQSGLNTYIFGQAVALVESDLWVMGTLGAAVLLVVVLLYKELKILCFDRGFGSSLGLPMRSLEVLFTCLLVTVVVVGLQTVGVILMVAALITPAAAARQWTDRLGAMVILAGVLGGASGASGSLLSAQGSKVPPGPTIVLVSSAMLGFSLCFAPRRGLLWGFWRERRMRSQVRRENLLKDLYLVGEGGSGWDRHVSPPALMGMRGRGARELHRTARALIAARLADRAGDALRLTNAGREEAEQVVRKHRLWEVYLTRRLELPRDHVHRDAEAMEHALSEAEVADLEERLGFPAVDPHGKPIPARRGVRQPARGA